MCASAGLVACWSFMERATAALLDTVFSPKKCGPSSADTLASPCTRRDRFSSK